MGKMSTLQETQDKSFYTILKRCKIEKKYILKCIQISLTQVNSGTPIVKPYTNTSSDLNSWGFNVTISLIDELCHAIVELEVQ